MTRRRLARLALLLALALPLTALGRPSAARAVQVTWTPATPRPGDLVLVRVTGGAPDRAPEGTLDAEPLRFFPLTGGYAALAGVDLETRPGRYPWTVTVAGPGGASTHVAGWLRVGPRAFAEERLTLPPHLVDLDPETERRALAEGEALRILYRLVTPGRLWREPFVPPIAGAGPGSGFGARRVINGRPRAPHAGLDYAAPRGTPVVAANAGRVALVAEYFFPGRLVVLDHGLGLHTLYFHLDEVWVAPDERVARGQPIGTVGATGRATGPHLHFGVQVGAARVDPATLLQLDLRD